MDTVPVSFAVSEVSCSGTPNVEKVDIDGLGRESRTELQSDPAGNDDNRIRSTILMGQAYWLPIHTRDDQRSNSTGLSQPTDTTRRAVPISVTRPDTTAINYSYTGAATKTTEEGNGSARHSTIAQTDALGRIVSACEVTSATQQGSGSADTTPAACGQDISATGFLTSYIAWRAGQLEAPRRRGTLRS